MVVAVVMDWVFAQCHSDSTENHFLTRQFALGDANRLADHMEFFISEVDWEKR